MHILLEIIILAYDRVFKTEKKLEQFYSLLIKESLDREDVNSLEKENVRLDLLGL